MVAFKSGNIIVEVDILGYSSGVTSYNELTDKPIIPDSLSDLSDDSTHRLVTDIEKSYWNDKLDSFTELDPVFSASPASNVINTGDGTMYLSDDGTYKTVEGGVTSVNGEVGDVTLTIPDELSDLTDDSTHRLVTDSEKSIWNAKQDALGFTPEDISNKSTNILLGNSDILYPSQNAVKSYIDTELNNKADKLTITERTYLSNGKINTQKVNGVFKTAVYTNGVLTQWQ